MRLVDAIRHIGADIAVHPTMRRAIAYGCAMISRILQLADRRRRVVAVTGAVLLHLLFLLFILPQTSKGLSAGGSGGVGEAGDDVGGKAGPVG